MSRAFHDSWLGDPITTSAGDRETCCCPLGATCSPTDKISSTCALRSCSFVCVCILLIAFGNQQRANHEDGGHGFLKTNKHGQEHSVHQYLLCSTKCDSATVESLKIPGFIYPLSSGSAPSSVKQWRRCCASQASISLPSSCPLLVAQRFTPLPCFR